MNDEIIVDCLLFLLDKIETDDPEKSILEEKLFEMKRNLLLGGEQ